MSSTVAKAGGSYPEIVGRGKRTRGRRVSRGWRRSERLGVARSPGGERRGTRRRALSRLVFPEATATARTPRLRPQRTSWIESPTTTIALALEAKPGGGVGPLHGHGREAVAILVVRAEGAEAEVAVDAEGLELEAGARLEVSGEQAEGDRGSSASAARRGTIPGFGFTCSGRSDAARRSS